MKRAVVSGALALLALGGLFLAAGSGWMSLGRGSEAVQATDERPLPTGNQSTAQPSGSGDAAMQRAAAHHKYLFAMFWKNDDPQTVAMKEVLAHAVKKAAGRAESVVVCVSDPMEKGIVERFELDRAPMPLVLVIAPNGAVMGGFPQKCTEEEILEAFGSPCTEKCMKSLQEGKLVFLCVTSRRGPYEPLAVPQGVRDFKADSRFAGATEVVLVDADDPNEAGFLRDLRVDPTSPMPLTVFLAPPGALLGKFDARVTKERLIAELTAAQSNPCAGGKCGPNGCGPKK